MGYRTSHKQLWLGRVALGSLPSWSLSCSSPPPFGLSVNTTKLQQARTESCGNPAPRLMLIFFPLFARAAEKQAESRFSFPLQLTEGARGGKRKPLLLSLTSAGLSRLPSCLLGKVPKGEAQEPGLPPSCLRGLPHLGSNLPPLHLRARLHLGEEHLLVSGGSHKHLRRRWQLVSTAEQREWGTPPRSGNKQRQQKADLCSPGGGREYAGPAPRNRQAPFPECCGSGFERAGKSSAARPLQKPTLSAGDGRRFRLKGPRAVCLVSLAADAA